MMDIVLYSPFLLFTLAFIKIMVLQPFISSSFIVFSFIFNLPFSISQAEVEVDYRYSNCSQFFDCGRCKNISYPFWSNTRPDYCGHPSFKLDCPRNGQPLIQIADQNYTVLAINANQTLQIARTDSWSNNCPTGPIVNTTLDDNLFSFPAPITRFLTLFYGCPSLTKETNATNSTGHDSAWSWSNPVDLYPELKECKSTIIVPVLGTAVPNNWTVEEVVNAGFEVKYKVEEKVCKECETSGGYCGYNQTKAALQCYCRHGLNQRTCANLRRAPPNLQGNGRKKIIIAAIVAGTLITVAAIAILCWYFKNKSNTSMILWKRKAKNVNIVETFLRDCGLLAPNRFKYKDVKKITSSFKDIIGQGGFGSVFKGKLPDGRLVAVKTLSETKGNGKDFINEVATISRTSHVNIVSLLGFCVQGTKRALIYEFMPNGSLEKFIYDTPLNAHAHLGWETLYKIAIGIARGLEYLHRGCNTRILHLDIKPHNILLDQDFTPKIADFGLSKLCHLKESQVSMTGARGTAGYIAPEMVSRNFGAVSHKADVYSYGMMVLEMVGGRKNIDVNVTNVSEVYFPHWIYNRLDLNEDLGLHEINSLEDQEIARKMILVGLWCIQIDPVNRPPMSRVLDMLEGSLEALQLPPKPFLTSSPREEVSSSRSIISTV